MLEIALAIAILVIGVIVIIAINAEKDKNKSASSGNLKLDKTNSETTSKKENETTKNEETTTSSEETTSSVENIQETATENPITPLSKNMYVTGSANVRDSYDTNSAILGKLELNKEVQVTGKIGEWYQIVYYDRYAFIHETLLSDNQVETEKVTEKRNNSNSNNNNNNNNNNSNSYNNNNVVDNGPNNSNNNNSVIGNNVDNNGGEDYNPAESAEERAARVNPNWYKHDKINFVYNSDGSGDIYNTIMGFGSSTDDLLHFISTFSFLQEDLLKYHAYGYGCRPIRKFMDGDYAHFDIRDYYFGVVDENWDSYVEYYYDENFNLQIYTD